MMNRPLPSVGFAVTVLLLAGCGGGGGSVTPSTTQNVAFPTTPIKHVVIMVQENRSFDNLFRGFPGANSDGSSATVSSKSGPVTLTQTTLEAGVDMCHFHTSFEIAYDAGKLDDFAGEQTCGITSTGYGPTGVSNAMYAYVEQSEVQPYWSLASTYTLADDMFQSNSGPSYPAHQYLIAGQSDFAAEVPSEGPPWGCDSPPGTTVNVLQPSGQEVVGPFPCFNYQTLADLLDAKGVSWRYYAPALNTTGGDFSAYDAINHIRYGADWANVISPETTVLTDIANGNLPSVAWVIPSFPNSDHPLAASNTGPAWVTSVVNAIGSSQYWNSTAIFILWDDWGGWYDHVKPPALDIMGLGFRVPLIVVSPYAKHGYVSHVQYEEASILKFTEENFGLPSLGQADARANNLLDCFDFTQTVTPFAKVRAEYDARYFINEVHVMGPNDPDD